MSNSIKDSQELTSAETAPSQGSIDNPLKRLLPISFTVDLNKLEDAAIKSCHTLNEYIKKLSLSEPSLASADPSKRRDELAAMIAVYEDMYKVQSEMIRPHQFAWYNSIRRRISEDLATNRDSLSNLIKKDMKLCYQSFSKTPEGQAAVQEKAELYYIDRYEPGFNLTTTPPANYLGDDSVCLKATGGSWEPIMEDDKYLTHAVGLYCDSDQQYTAVLSDPVEPISDDAGFEAQCDEQTDRLIKSFRDHASSVRMMSSAASAGEESEATRKREASVRTFVETSKVYESLPMVAKYNSIRRSIMKLPPAGNKDEMYAQIKGDVASLEVDGMDEKREMFYVSSESGIVLTQHKPTEKDKYTIVWNHSRRSGSGHPLNCLTPECQVDMYCWPYEVKGFKALPSDKVEVRASNPKLSLLHLLTTRRGM